MKVLITGVAGLIGAHFSKYLLDKRYDVYGIDDLSGGYMDYVDQRLIESRNFSYINLLEDKILDNIFDYFKPDVVFHFAAYAAEGLSPFIRRYNYENNLITSVNIINSCIKHNTNKLIFTSSMSVYGVGNPPFTEEQPLSPIDPYAIAKYTVEQDIKQAHDQFGLNYTIIRPHNIIGIYQNIWDRYRNVIGIWIRRILNKESILIYGDGLQERAFSDIDYYMEPFEKVIDNFNTETFNIGADKPYRIIDAANLIKKIANKHGYDCNIEHKEPRHEVKYAYCDHTKAKKMLDFKDDTNVEDLFEKMFLWAKEQPDRDIKYMPYEIEKGIYSYWK